MNETAEFVGFDEAMAALKKGKTIQLVEAYAGKHFKPARTFTITEFTHMANPGISVLMEWHDFLRAKFIIKD